MNSNDSNKQLRARLQDARVYLCVDARRHLDNGRPAFSALRDLVEEVCEGGCDIVQLRDKNSPGEQQYGPLTVLEELETLAVIREVTHRHGALLSVNDRMDIAVAAQADVAHIGQDDLPTADARALIGPDMLLGLSCHSEAELDAALVNPYIDYFCAGPVWKTPTKPGRPAAGMEVVRHAAAISPEGGDGSRPWFAIGGIDLNNLPEVREAGASRIVVVRALTNAPDPAATARQLRTDITNK